jgi:hypothetical protein
MRVLFSTTAGSGHFGPLIPFAKACRDAGQMVKVAAPASFATDVSRAGLDHAPFDDVPSDVIGPLFGRLPEMSFEQANATVIGEIFGRLDARAALPGVAEIVDHWKPDVVVREPCEFASLVAAERAPDMPMRVLLTTGRGIDPASLGPIPANIHVEQWWPQADVMPHTAAVVGHGGFGTTMMTLGAAQAVAADMARLPSVTESVPILQHLAAR